MQFLSILVSLAITTSLAAAQPQNGQLEDCQTKCPGEAACNMDNTCQCFNNEQCLGVNKPDLRLECETKCPGEAYDCKRAGGDNNVCRCSNKERCLQVSKAPPPLEDCQTKCPGEVVCDLSTGNICECPNNGQCLRVEKPDLSRPERCETKCPGEASGCQRVGGDNNVCWCSNKERCLGSIPPPQCPS